MKKKEIKIAKAMYRKSLTGTFVDPKKAKSQIKQLMAQKVARTVKVLKAYKRLIETALQKEEVQIESAAAIPNHRAFEKKIMEKTKAKRITYKINPQVGFGAKITHGDWIYDETLNSKLQQITQNQS